MKKNWKLKLLAGLILTALTIPTAVAESTSPAQRQNQSSPTTAPIRTQAPPTTRPSQTAKKSPLPGKKVHPSSRQAPSKRYEKSSQIDAKELSKIKKTLSEGKSEEKKSLLRKLIASLPPSHFAQKSLARAASRLLFDKNQEVRLLAGELLSRMGPEFFHLYRPALSHKWKKARWAATYALSRLPRHTDETRRALTLMLRDKYFRVKWQAAWGLGRLKKLNDLEFLALYRLLLREKGGSTRLAAANSLQRAGGRAAPAWAQCLRRETVSIIRWECFRLLHRLAGDLPPLRTYLSAALKREDDPFFAAKMADLLATSAVQLQLPPEELKKLTAMLTSHPQIEVRRRGILLIAELYRTKKINLSPLLIKLQRYDPSPQIRKLAEKTKRKMMNGEW